MYTYDSFETLGAFTLLRPIFVTFIIAALFMFFIIIIPKLRRKMTSGLSVVGLSFVSIIASAQLLYYDAIIVDELGLGGDEITTYMFFVILLFSIINPIIFYIRRKRTEVSQINLPQ
ncbi:hypothetical protein [Metabacillus rhizolycopersici]|uniref:Uncharacterized protein n=1 Tax=Metabacillus rhizolycopersici TaxID=2875709 RepID=A0ABS7UVE4_9BACI|nr:hypothetical protein [Metabacillus rhizolycopersici]MBZ5752126.1 hypothetical protein [Metabacillus rhizolycopersici]